MPTNDPKADGACNVVCKQGDISETECLEEPFDQQGIVCQRLLVARCCW